MIEKVVQRIVSVMNHTRSNRHKGNDIRNGHGTYVIPELFMYNSFTQQIPSQTENKSGVLLVPKRKFSVYL